MSLRNFKNSNLLLILCIAFLSLGNEKCTHAPMTIDPSKQAAAGNDKTIIFQGLGQISKKGYLFIQKREGTLPNDPLTVVVPLVKCQRDSCIEIMCFRKDGSPGFSQGILKGQDRLNLLLSDILRKETAVEITDDGEYSCMLDVTYSDIDGFEHSFFINGFIRLNVLSKDYSSLGCESPMIAWRTQINDKCEAQFTTAGRSTTCGEGCI